MFTKGERCSQIMCGEYPNHRCFNKAKVERDGKPYCGIHDPEYIKEKDRKWREAFEEKWVRDQAISARIEAMRNACEGLTTQELSELSPNLLRQAPRMYEALKEIRPWLVGYTELKILVDWIDKALTGVEK